MVVLLFVLIVELLLTSSRLAGIFCAEFCIIPVDEGVEILDHRVLFISRTQMVALITLGSCSSLPCLCHVTVSSFGIFFIDLLRSRRSFLLKNERLCLSETELKV